MSATSQVNKAYTEVVTDTGITPLDRLQKAYVEAITDNGGAVASRAMKLYIEVITDPPPVGGTLTGPLICVCT